MKRLVTITIIFAATVLVAAATVVSTTDELRGLSVHEWGTFTSIAGEDGAAMTWLPWGGPNDLPCFVDRFKNRTKASYAAKVRMETPVLYFYAPRETTVNVKVRFPHGLITEWFPNASVTPDIYNDDVAAPTFAGTIAWNHVRVKPNASPEFPKDNGPSHYYAARSTDAAALESGSQKEKFLFYRGIGDFELPITATIVGADGVHVRNLGIDPIANVILFENRDGMVGYRVGGMLRETLTLKLPPPTSDLASLRQELVKTLISAGLYPKEAAAMVETWGDSWFEEGARLFYVLPQRSIDAILPLQVSPAPAHTSRVFVGRMELMTPTTMTRIRSAIAANDRAALQRYGRFLEPVRSRILLDMSPTDGARAQALFQAVASDYFSGTALPCR